MQYQAWILRSCGSKFSRNVEQMHIFRVNTEYLKDILLVFFSVPPSSLHTHICCEWLILVLFVHCTNRFFVEHSLFSQLHRIERQTTLIFRFIFFFSFLHFVVLLQLEHYIWGEHEYHWINEFCKKWSRFIRLSTVQQRWWWWVHSFFRYKSCFGSYLSLLSDGLMHLIGKLIFFSSPKSRNRRNVESFETKTD